VNTESDVIIDHLKLVYKFYVCPKIIISSSKAMQPSSHNTWNHIKTFHSEYRTLI